MELVIGCLKTFAVGIRGLRWVKVRTQLGGLSKRMCAYDGEGGGEVFAILVRMYKWNDPDSDYQLSESGHVILFLIRLAASLMQSIPCQYN